MFSRSSEYPSRTPGGFGHSENESPHAYRNHECPDEEGKLERLLSCGDGIVYKSFMKMEWFAP
jgi:hypothetical protein